ncbi:MAG: FG-GAP repeat domain-containing protein [Planctomycetota bacterium]
MRRFAHIATLATAGILLVPVGCGDDEGGGPGAFSPTFTEIEGLGLMGVSHCSVAWGDADNDGDLDLAVAGHLGGGGYSTKVYENVGGAVPFDGTELATGLTGVASCSLAWGDADNDGDLDLAVAGWAGSADVTKVYENRDGQFDGAWELATGLTGMARCSLAWGDADNDGDLDLAVAGYFWGPNIISRVYENRDGQLDGAWELATGLMGVADCSLAWGDVDNDGDLDLAVAGWAGSADVTKVYENRAGQFDGAWELATGLTGVELCSLAWGDADNDGDLDLAVAGYFFSSTEGEGCIMKIHENRDGQLDGAWELATGLTEVEYCSLAWGDVDNDGDLDLALAGNTTSGYIAKVYEADGSPPNMPPDQMTGLSAFIAGGEAVLMWSEGSDAETPAGGLSYNLRVVDTGSGLDVSPAMASADGWRRIPAIGPIRPGPSYAWHSLTLPSGDYEFQVQAIDSALEGGPWSEPCPFTVP